MFLFHAQLTTMPAWSELEHSCCAVRQRALPWAAGVGPLLSYICGPSTIQLRTWQDILQMQLKVCQENGESFLRFRILYPPATPAASWQLQLKFP